MGVSGLMAVGPPTTLPGWLLPIKALILLFSVIILVLAAFAQSQIRGYIVATPSFLIFLAILTWIVYGGNIVIERKAPWLYYRIVILLASIISCIFWLTAWTWAVSSARNVFVYSVSGLTTAFGAAMAGISVVGVFTWLLCLNDLVLFARSAIRDNSSAGVIELSQIQKQDPSRIY